jgi:hypothetical protein
LFSVRNRQARKRERSMARNREIVVAAVVAACVAAGGAVGAMKAFAGGTPGIGMPPLDYQLYG